MVQARRKPFEEDEGFGGMGGGLVPEDGAVEDDEVPGSDGRMLKRGQLFMGREWLSQRTGLSTRQIRTAHEKLTKLGFLTTESTNEGTMVTLLQYDVFCPRKLRTDQRSDRKTTRQRPESDHETTTVEEVEESEELEEGEEEHISANADVSRIAEAYNSRIHTARLTDAAEKKILARLRTWTMQELLAAIDCFAASAWWMEHNARRGMKWFFESDDRIEQFLGLGGESGHAAAQSWGANIVRWEEHHAAS